MLRITQELRHFEATFLTPTGDPRRYKARIFDLFEELPFAGHPIIGAAAALHAADGTESASVWTFDLATKSVTVETHRTTTGYFCTLDQGAAEFLGEPEDTQAVVAAFGLSPDDLDPALPLAVVSTGLAYVIVPVRSGTLGRATIKNDITSLVQGLGAQFAVLLDDAALEVRHWNNDGIVEDIATGSAAGAIGAYRLKYGRTASGQAFTLNQGRFVGRPSRLIVEPHGTREMVHAVRVGGDVTILGQGQLDLLPSPGLRPVLASANAAFAL